MSEVQIASGTAWIQKGFAGDRINITSFKALLEHQANCTDGGYSSCYGYSTFINAETGELMMTWITGTGAEEDEFVVNVNTYTAGLPIVKALYAARKAAE